MSTGPGRIERTVLARIERHRKIIESERKRNPEGPPHPLHLTSWDVAAACYGGNGHHWRPTPAQHKAVSRAMHSFVRKFPQFALLGGQGRRRLQLYELADPMSVLLAEREAARRGGKPLSYLDLPKLIDLATSV